MSDEKLSLGKDAIKVVDNPKEERVDFYYQGELHSSIPHKVLDNTTIAAANMFAPWIRRAYYARREMELGTDVPSFDYKPKKPRKRRIPDVENEKLDNDYAERLDKEIKNSRK